MGRKPRAAIGGAVVKDPRFAKIPFAMVAEVRDGQLEPADVLAYAIVLDCARDGLATISHDRIGKRIGCEARAAARCMGRLDKAGWLETVDNGNGRKRTYRVKTLSMDGGGTKNKPCPSVTGVVGKTLSPDGHRTLSTDGHLRSRRNSLDVRTYAQKENGAVELGEQLIDALSGLGWSTRKIASEAGTIRKQIAPEDEEAFVLLLGEARQRGDVRKPFPFALKQLRAGYRARPQQPSIPRYNMPQEEL